MPTPISGNAPINPLDYQVDPTDFASAPTAPQSTLQASTASGITESLKVSLPAPEMSWVDYLATVSANLSTSKRQLQESQLADDLATQQQYILLAQSALNNLNLLAQLQQAILQAAVKAQALGAKIDTLVPTVNAAIDAYNDGSGVEASFTDRNGDTVTVKDNGLDSDRSEWQRLQNSYSDYQNVINNPDSTPEEITAAQAKLNDDINRYNLYVQIRQPTIQAYNDIASPTSEYNTTAVQYNQAIGVLNEIGAAVGIDPIPAQAVLGQVTTLESYIGQNIPGIPQPPNANIDHVDTSSDKVNNAAELYNDYYDAVVKELEKVLKNASKKLAMNENFADLLKYFIGNLAKIDAPAAYINIEPGKETKPVATGSTVGQGDSLSNQNLISILSQSLNSQQQLSVEIPDTNILQPKVINDLGIAFLQILGLSAVIPSLSLMTEKFGNLGPYSKALDTALQAQSLQQLVGALHTGDVLNQLDAALKLRFPDLTDQQIAAISAGLQLALVTVSASLLANSLNLPGLTSQLLALASGKPETQAVADQNQPPSLDQSLANQAVLQQLQQLLVLNTQVSAESANKVVFDAAIASQQKQQEQDAAASRADSQLRDLRRIDDFQNSVLTSLKQQGIEDQQAQSAAIQSGDLLRSQIQSSNLQSAQLSADNLRFDILQESIAASLKQAEIAKSNDEAVALSKEVSSNVFGSARNLTDAQIRNNLELELPKAVPGITAQQATVVANAAVVVPQTPVGVNPLTQPNITQGLSKPDVALNLTESVINQLTPSVGYSKATELASLVTQSQIGAADKNASQNNALDVLTDRTNFVSSLQNRSDAQVAANTFADFIAPYSSLAELGDKIRSPAYAMTFEGIMYSHPQPTPGMGQARDVSPTSIPV